MTIKTWHAFLIVLGVLSAGFVWVTFYPDAPYSIFAPSVIAGAAGYGYKRLQQKKKEYKERYED